MDEFKLEPAEGDTPADLRGQKGSFEPGTIAAYLLRGVVYRDENVNLWNSLFEQQGKVQALVMKLGVKLVLDENEGYAYLRSLSEEEMPDLRQLPPRLMMKRQLSFNVSFLLLLLRHKLIEFDSESNGNTRLVMSSEAIVDMMRTYLRSRTNEGKLQNQLESVINKAVDLGFLKPLQDRRAKEEKLYEVMRILKAYFDAQKISDLSAKVEEYRQALQEKREEEEELHG